VEGWAWFLADDQWEEAAVAGVFLPFRKAMIAGRIETSTTTAMT
jgi:hypothetical protein